MILLTTILRQGLAIQELPRHPTPLTSSPRPYTSQATSHNTFLASITPACTDVQSKCAFCKDAALLSTDNRNDQHYSTSNNITGATPPSKIDHTRPHQTTPDHTRPYYLCRGLQHVDLQHVDSQQVHDYCPHHYHLLARVLGTEYSGLQYRSPCPLSHAFLLYARYSRRVAVREIDIVAVRSSTTCERGLDAIPANF
jgi:hypothetical protein